MSSLWFAEGLKLKPRLLVSVRNIDEAIAAAQGGAAIIDIKEPAHGPLGRAAATTIRHICTTLNTRFPDRSVSAALGEVGEWNAGTDSADRSAFIAFLASHQTPPSFVKLGLAGSTAPGDAWQSRWHAARQRITPRPSSAAPRPGTPHWIAVAYADFRRAGSPDVESVVREAIETGCSGVLVDTFVKDDTGLRDWITPARLLRIRDLTRSARLWLALAGRVALRDLNAIQGIAPDIIAVRGAVCELGSRTNAVQESLVREFLNAIQEGSDSAGVLPHDPASAPRSEPASF